MPCPQLDLRLFLNYLTLNKAKSDADPVGLGRLLWGVLLLSEAKNMAFECVENAWIR